MFLPKQPIRSPRRIAVRALLPAAALVAVLFTNAGDASSGDESVTEPRLELIQADGTVEPIAVTRVLDRRARWWDETFDLRGGTTSFAAATGAEVIFVTDDPRAAVDRVVLTVPKPLPPALTARIAAANHPRLREVTLEVRDAKSGLALTDAVFEAAERGAPVLTERADEHGRIALREASGRSGFERWHRPGFWIHAPGHLGSEGSHRGYRRGEGHWTAPESSEMEDVVAGRPIRVRLDPFDRGVKVEERKIRILAADGTPVSGAFVWLPWTLARSPFGLAATGKSDLCDGFRRTGSDGLVSIPIFPASPLPVAGIEIRLPSAETEFGGVPFIAYALTYDTLPRDGVREIRLPAVATIELTIEGLPPGESAEIGADALGLARTPSDGPAAPILYDPGVEAMLSSFESQRNAPPGWEKPKGAFIAGCEFDVRGSFRRDGPPYRRPVPVGRTTTIWMERPIGQRDAGDGSIPTERRSLEIHPERPGPLKVTKRWTELPLAK